MNRDPASKISPLRRTNSSLCKNHNIPTGSSLYSRHDYGNYYDNSTKRRTKIDLLGREMHAGLLEVGQEQIDRSLVDLIQTIALQRAGHPQRVVQIVVRIQTTNVTGFFSITGRTNQPPPSAVIYLRYDG